jgi:hypothetical protein
VAARGLEIDLGRSRRAPRREARALRQRAVVRAPARARLETEGRRARRGDDHRRPEAERRPLGVAAERAAAPYRYGSLAGVLRTGERYGIVLQKGSALTARVNAAVRALVDNGTVSRLQRRWLSADLGQLRVLG